MRAVFWLCPNANGFHPDGPKIYYLLLLGVEVVTKSKIIRDEDGTKSRANTHYFRDKENAVIWVDDPPVKLLDMITNSEQLELKFIERICHKCHASGVKGWDPMRLIDQVLWALFADMVDVEVRKIPEQLPSELQEGVRPGQYRGLCIMEGDGTTTIYIDPRHDEIAIESTLVHEVLHFLFPNAGERWILARERTLFSRLSYKQKAFLGLIVKEENDESLENPLLGNAGYPG